MCNHSKHKNGFTLLEATVALLVLMVCLSTLGPILSRVSSERESILQTETALAILNNQLTNWSAGNSELPVDSTQNNVHFNLIWKHIEPGTIELCVTWKNSLERDKAICGKTKR